MDYTKYGYKQSSGKSLPPAYEVEFSDSHEPGVDEKLIRELASLRFLDDAGNIVFVGPPGTG